MPHPKKIALACALALAATTVLAQGHVIKDIRLEGISRTEAGTVFSHLPIRVGDTYSPELGAESLRSLYASGMFQDVQLDMDGNVLVVRVQERPQTFTLPVFPSLMPKVLKNLSVMWA